MSGEGGRYRGVEDDGELLGLGWGWLQCCFRLSSADERVHYSFFTTARSGDLGD